MRLRAAFLFVPVLVVGGIVWGCSSSSNGPPVGVAGGCVTRAAGHPFTVRIHPVDEKGAPVSGASADTGNGPTPLASDLSLQGPTTITLTAPGFLKEPLVLGPGSDNQDVTVRMWNAMGGKRIAIHSTGDVMLGRRYETPKAGDPLIPQ